MVSAQYHEVKYASNSFESSYDEVPAIASCRRTLDQVGNPSAGIQPSASHTQAHQWLTRTRIEKNRAVSATYELTEYRTLSRSHHLP